MKTAADVWGGTAALDRAEVLEQQQGLEQRLDAIEAGFAGGYATKAALDLVTPTAGLLAYVTGDPNAALRGLYLASGAAWNRTSYQPASAADFAALTAAGVAATADRLWLTPAERTKLAALDTAAALRDRATHTGSQPLDSVTGLSAALNDKAAVEHVHTIAQITGLQSALDDLRVHGGRPGEVPSAFTSSLVGFGRDLSPISIGEVVPSTEGRAYKVSQTGAIRTIAARFETPIETGVAYAGMFAVRRLADTPDPIGDAVEFGVAWLSPTGTLIGQHAFDFRGLKASEGRRSMVGAFGRNVPDVTVVPPADAAYFREFIRLHGTAGDTSVETLKAWTGNGLPGATGNAGWTPVLANVTDGESRVVQRVIDWTGGQGVKPATGQYVATEGLVSTAAAATNLQGQRGSQGLIGSRWRGPYSGATSYIVGDFVSAGTGAGGALEPWIAVAPTLGNAPGPESAFWDAFPAATVNATLNYLSIGDAIPAGVYAPAFPEGGPQAPTAVPEILTVSATPTTIRITWDEPVNADFPIQDTEWLVTPSA